MSLTTYNSVATNDSRKEKPKISQLARDSFEAFRPFINIFDCGNVFMDSVIQRLNIDPPLIHRW